MNEKKSVKTFKKKYKLKNITSKNLSEVLNKQGFTLVEYNGADDNEDVKTLISVLNLKEFISNARCFTYQDDKYRLVFLNENLNEDEKIIVLAHEEGHIWHKHLNSASVFGEDILQEYQANEFCHFLLESRAEGRSIIKTIMSVLISALVTGVLVVASLSWHNREAETQVYYKTVKGIKYHLSGCIYVKDKEGVVELTKEEYESGKYQPCSVCMPGER